MRKYEKTNKLQKLPSNRARQRENCVWLYENFVSNKQRRGANYVEKMPACVGIKYF